MTNPEKISENTWTLKKEGNMNVPGKIFASDILMENIKKDSKTLDQVKNVAMLKGIVGESIAMCDAHQGYGFCIGGVAAFDLKKGIISPGGVGYDIGCGVRLLTSNLNKSDFLKKRKEVLDQLARDVPSGVGKESDFILDDKELKKVLEQGVNWAVEKGYATKEDLEHIEDDGCIKGADASKVSQKAIARGRKQLGSLGSGNHFLEIQIVDEVLDFKTANILGLKKDQVVVMIHSGSRGLGHQTGSDYIMKMEKEYGFSELPDRELICAPIDSSLGRDYRGAMNASANFAFVNRQLMTHQIRSGFKKIFPTSKLELVYDIAHNIAKFEKHSINGKKQEVCVHRKGATRSFGPGRKEIPSVYRKIGCPIFIPGSMGTYSYVLIGTKKAEEISFGSTAHGAGRIMSRSKAIANIPPEKVLKDLENYGVLIKAGSKKGVVEEAPEAYKDVSEVVKVSDALGIGKIVARLRPIAVLKG
ncbi:RNA-splicing ligase RtcB [Candidatus Pacearchaeota archaeon CG10_big_fil_rev_8_21_14_0_10_31_24]|nr:MAG: RNA-splicing ligase RtcB [Candidatus Pacearchaeota archaeon CG10_big_fil_rev_8_21_14_0_10_31_24]